MSYIQKIRNSELFKVTSLNGINIIVKVISGLFTSKFLAIFVGPAGMALIGNLRNFLTSVESLTSLGFQNGIVKYVAEAQEDMQRQRSILSTLLMTLLVVCMVSGIVLFGYAEYWNQLIFGVEVHYEMVFKMLAFLLPLYIGSLYLIAVINGFQKFKSVIFLNIYGSLISLFLTCFLVWKHATIGALLSIIIAPSVLFFIALFYLFQEIDWKGVFHFRYFDAFLLKDLSHYFVMALVSGILGPIVFIAIRNNLISHFSAKEAGYWEAMTRLSSYYMLFVNTLLMVYYYPKLVTATNNEETKSVFWGFYKEVMPFFALGLLLLFIGKAVVVKVVFTNDFEPVNQLFLGQLIGDLFKAFSWILGLQFFAKKMTKQFIITEILSYVILYVSSLYCIANYGWQGVVIAHAFMYFMYVLVLGVYFRKKIF